MHSQNSDADELLGYGHSGSSSSRAPKVDHKARATLAISVVVLLIAVFVGAVTIKSYLNILNLQKLVRPH